LRAATAARIGIGSVLRSQLVNQWPMLRRLPLRARLTCV
jgi:hypothetical protein